MENIEVQDLYDDKPPSPVLSTGAINRKKLIIKKQKRSRINLSQRFSVPVHEKNSDVVSTASAPNQTDICLKQIEKLPQDFQSHMVQLQKTSRLDLMPTKLTFKSPVLTITNSERDQLDVFHLPLDHLETEVI